MMNLFLLTEVAFRNLIHIKSLVFLNQRDFIYSLAFNRASFAAMNARMSSDMSSSFSHCSLYNVTGKRPMP
jgi:hypothetical protein